jgi:hypothetical protein
MLLPSEMSPPSRDSIADDGAESPQRWTARRRATLVLSIPEERDVGTAGASTR